MTPPMPRAASGLALALAALLYGQAAQGQGRTVPEAPDPAPYRAEPLANPLPLNATSDNPSRLLPMSIGEAIGDWQLSDGSRSCTVSLTGDSGPNGKIVRFPGGCRRSLPVLGGVAGWLFGDGAVRLVDRDIMPVLLFERSKDERSFVARSGGRSYRLSPGVIGLVPMAAAVPTRDSIPDIAGSQRIPGSQPVQPERMLRQPDMPIAADSDPMLSTLRGMAAASDPNEPRRVAIEPVAPLPKSDEYEPAQSMPNTATPEPVETQIAMAPDASASRPADRPKPGTYALDRFSEKDVCRIALEPRPAALAAAPDTTLAPARILPGCRDSGIAVFEPVSWRFANGHMTLKAKRGHAINLVANGQGAWRRDPDSGSTFVLRMVDP